MRVLSPVIVMFTFLTGIALAAPGSAADKPLETVENLDLERTPQPTTGD